LTIREGGHNPTSEIMMTKSTIIGAAMVAAAAVAVPVLAWSQATPDGPGGGHHRWEHDRMAQSPQQACEDHIARRAGFAAYIAAKLDLTPDQKPLWDKVQAAMQASADKQRQVCATLKPASERGQETMIDRMNTRQAMLTAQLQGLQQVEPAVQALYQSLTPAQKAVMDHPFHRG
jgi:hypothetical protein